MMRNLLAAAAVLLVVPLSAATGRPALPSCTSDYEPFTSLGCFQDDNSADLVHRSAQDQNSMTIEKCTAECKSNGFRYAGLKYYGVCYCGSAVNGAQVDSSQCFEPCSGDKTQTCGSDNTLSIWQDPTFADGPADVTVEDYKSLGCYTDDSSVGRTLSYPIDLDSSTFTTSTCIDACRQQGFAYAGTEYGSECWCGPLLADDSTLVDSSQCQVACSGDSTLKCGGGSRLDLYVATELESSEPCGSDSSGTTTTAGTTTATTTTATTTTATTTTATTTTAITTTAITTTATTSTTTALTTTTSTTTTQPTTTSTTTTAAPTTTTTTKPTTTTLPTTTTKPTTTTTASQCTVTTTVPATCEFQCGNWCAPALPDWNNQADCVIAAKTCAVQAASCFASAGWPAAINCFEFSSWCNSVSSYCSKSPRGQCSKSDCWSKNKPSGGQGPSTTTKVVPCSTTTMVTSTKPATTTSCPPNPTNICTQPSSDRWGYGPGKPAGGISLPVVGCNDDKNDWSRNPFKFYNSADSQRCPSFSWNQRPNVCSDACQTQYNNCHSTYVSSCGNLSWKSSWKRAAGETDEEFERRTFFGSWFGSKSSNDYGSCASYDSRSEWSQDGCDAVQCWGRGANSPSLSEQRCKAQLNDCLAANKQVSPGSSCKSWCGN